MTAHLIVLTVGPVQEFIAAARRTRDLWLGSYLLSEVSKAAARAIGQAGGKLIFPAPADEVALQAGSALNVANVILAELTEADPASAARSAKVAAQACWRAFADPVFERCLDLIDRDVWAEQVDDVIEFHAAWYPCTAAGYQADRAAVMRLLSARKRCRDFLPAQGRAGVPKSSLDGLRESVLRRPLDRHAKQRLRVNDGEQLDVVGLVKRNWAPSSGPLQYPSVARVAADPWLRGISPRERDGIAATCRGLGHDVLHQLDISDGRGHPHYAGFPFEGTAVFRARHRNIAEDAGVDVTALRPLADAVDRLVRSRGGPSPYLAVLVADGDRMGQALSRLTSADDHRAFSLALAGFAVDARRIVRDGGGVLAYAGGDDVLAFVPVDRALACARSLRDRFSEVLGESSASTGVRPTLSVGLAVAHFMEPMEDLLDYGRTAERHAKAPRGGERGQTERDGLAVHVVKRGGETIAVRAGWDSSPDEHLTQLADWLAEGSVPGRVAYDMHKVADVYDDWPVNLAEGAIRRDVMAMMHRKSPRSGDRMPEIRDLVRARVSDAASLRGLANEMLVARQIAVARGQAAPAAKDGGELP